MSWCDNSDVNSKRKKCDINFFHDCAALMHVYARKARAHTCAYLVWFVSQRHRSPFLRTPQHQSATVVVRVAVHHGGGRHRVPEVRSAAQLGATAATRRRSRSRPGSRRGRVRANRGERLSLTRAAGSWSCSCLAPTPLSWSPSG